MGNQNKIWEGDRGPIGLQGFALIELNGESREVLQYVEKTMLDLEYPNTGNVKGVLAGAGKIFYIVLNEKIKRIILTGLCHTQQEESENI